MLPPFGCFRGKIFASGTTRQGNNPRYPKRICNVISPSSFILSKERLGRLKPWLHFIIPKWRPFIIPKWRPFAIPKLRHFVIPKLRHFVIPKQIAMLSAQNYAISWFQNYDISSFQSDVISCHFIIPKLRHSKMTPFRHWMASFRHPKITLHIFGLDAQIGRPEKKVRWNPGIQKGHFGGA